MTSVDIGSLVAEATSGLATRPPADGWAACASIWARVYVQAGPGWVKWPHLRTAADAAVTTALARATGSADPADEDLARLGAFDVEDDGSPEWQHVLDVTTMLLAALADDDLESTLHATVTTYLEGAFTMVANDHARAAGVPLRLPEAERALAADERWHRAVAFVRAL
ncbi:hypothetical protein [Amycolatopsis sp. NPDC098790]|uniref:hypothetical protein n=1 Tax=Amycolatopsis sp. NPDC098790 TaxID=3363939 RepID=UPI0038134363